MNLYAVYHEAEGRTHQGNAQYDGLFLVTASHTNQARDIVKYKLGKYFNDCVVQRLAEPDAPQIVLEFWREVPTRVRRSNERKQEEITA